MIGYVYLNIDDPLVAWLVYRAQLVSAPAIDSQALSFWATGRLRSRVQYAAEIAIDQIRLANYPGMVSRLSGFYAFPNLESATAAAAQWGIPYFRPERLAEIDIDDASRISRYDATWITDHFGSTDTAWAHQYYQGEATANPVWELLVDGRALVLGTDLREEAYTIVKAKWPGSLAFLEFGRIGVYLNSDIALITPIVTVDAAGVHVSYAMNMVDADNPDFLARLHAFDGPVNHAGLAGEDDLIVPDLRDRFFTLV